MAHQKVEHSRNADPEVNRQRQEGLRRTRLKHRQEYRKRELLDKVAARAVKLLKALPNQQEWMSWAERVLEEASLLTSDPPRKTPELWTERAIALNPDLLDQSAPYLLERDVRPDKAETFEELIRSLVPSEGGL
jgi:hypothetical protein